MNNSTAEKYINTKRQIEVDIVKGLAVLFMIFIHTMDFYLDESSYGTFYRIITFLGSAPAAPVFMFAMGIGFIYTKNNEPAMFFKRGISIFFLGYLLNFLRGFLPAFIGGKFGYYGLTEDGEWYTYLVEADILQFAGLAMIFYGLLKKIKIKEVYYPFIALTVGIITPFIRGIKTGITLVDIFIANINGGYDFIYHPFFSWIVYPLMGAFFGWLLIQVKDKDKFYLGALAISVPVTIICLKIYFDNPSLNIGIANGEPYKYFHHGLFGNILIGSFIVWWLAIWYFTSKILAKFMTKKLLYWSKFVTTIYIVHWLILGWLTLGLNLMFSIYTFNLVGTMTAMFVVLLLTDRITHAYNRLKNRV